MRFSLSYIYRERERKSECHTLFTEIKLFEHEFFRNCRMSSLVFEKLVRFAGLTITTPKTYKRSHNSRREIGFDTRDGQTTITKFYSIVSETFAHIVNEICSAIRDNLGVYIKNPESIKEWKQDLYGFGEKWILQNELAAMNENLLSCLPLYAQVYIILITMEHIVLFYWLLATRILKF